jgi:hypothetical protein
MSSIDRAIWRIRYTFGEIAWWWSLRPWRKI